MQKSMRRILCNSMQCIFNPNRTPLKSDHYILYDLNRPNDHISIYHIYATSKNRLSQIMHTDAPSAGTNIVSAMEFEHVTPARSPT